MRRVRVAVAAVILAVILSAQGGSTSVTGDPDEGATLFHTCEACHSLTAGQHMTGPSLAGLWGRKAGSAPGFTRYSEALKSSGVIWNADTLDAFLTDPRSFIPNNRMTFPGIRNAAARADLIAYLQIATRTQTQAQGGSEPGGMMGGMIGGMSGAAPSLRNMGPDQEVTSIRYCGNTYTVVTKSGETRQFWERNLRFKTDASPSGPLKGMPALVPSGMMGDRASIIFSGPDEMSASIEQQC